MSSTVNSGLSVLSSTALSGATAPIAATVEVANTACVELMGGSCLGFGSLYVGSVNADISSAFFSSPSSVVSGTGD